MPKYAYRELCRADRQNYDDRLSLRPRGRNANYAVHLAGMATGFISASETIGGTPRYVDANGGNGLVRIDVAAAQNDGARLVSKAELLRWFEAQGHWCFLDVVKKDREVLFVGPIARHAVLLIMRPRRT